MVGAGLWVRKPGTKTWGSQGASWFCMANRHVGDKRWWSNWEGPDSHRVPTFLYGVELYTLPAAEQVELGSLIKLYLSFPALGY